MSLNRHFNSLLGAIVLGIGFLPVVLPASPCSGSLTKFSESAPLSEATRLMQALGLKNELSSVPERKQKKILKAWRFWNKKNSVSPVQLDTLALELTTLLYGKDYSFWLSFKLSREELKKNMSGFWEKYRILREKIEALAQAENKSIRLRPRDRIDRSASSPAFQIPLTLLSNASSLIFVGLPSYLPRITVGNDTSIQNRFLNYQYLRLRNAFFLSVILSLGVSTWIVDDARIEAQSLENYLTTQQRLVSQLQQQKKLAPQSVSKQNSALEDLDQAWLEDFRKRKGRDPTPEDAEFILMQQLRNKSSK